jgi:hypothetical protein
MFGNGSRERLVFTRREKLNNKQAWDSNVLALRNFEAI